MQEPAAVHATATSQRRQNTDKATSPPRPVEDLDSGTDGDGELRSLVDGIAMLGRFEAQLAEFESTLGDAVVGGT